MYTQPKECPKCKTTGKFFIKKGYRKNKNDHQPVPKYRCKECGKHFSSHTFLPTYRQKKPYLNYEFKKYYSSTVSLRRLALTMECNLKTVVNKLKFVAAEAKKYHLEQIAKGAIQTTHVQFDEMETHEHTRMKPLSIALAVRAKMVKKSAKVSNTSEIIGFQVATMNCHGHNSAFAQLKYGIRPDTRAQACEDVLKVVAQCQKPGQTLTITTDAKSAYPAIIQKVLPSAIHNPVPNRIAHAGTAQPMFAFNSIAGKIRHDMSRMARRSWVTTKAAWALEAHLYIYLAWNNRYPIFQNRAGTV